VSDPTRYNLREIVDGYLGEEIAKRASGSSGSIWLTTLSSAPECMRKAVLATTHRAYREPMTIDGLRTMEMGTQQEDIVRSIARRMGVQFNPQATQSKLSDNAEPFPISGRIDFRYPDPDGRILEIKSAGERVFESVAKTGPQASKFSWVRSNYRQCQAQLWLSGDEEMAIAYWCRDRIEAVQFDITRDKGCIEDLAARALEIRSHCQEVTLAASETGNMLSQEVLDALPAHPGIEEEPDCLRCDYRGVCAPGMRYAITTFPVVDNTRLEERLKQVRAGKIAEKEQKDAWVWARDQLVSYWNQNDPTGQRCVMEVGSVSLRGSKSKNGVVVFKFEEEDE
jgi:hypothetical protein